VIDPFVTSRGISRAHKQIVEYAQRNNLQEVLIAEDDLCFTGRGAFDFFLDNKPTDFDIYLGSIYHGDIRKDNSVIDFSGLTMYIINQRFYDTFLSIREDKHLDRALRDKGRYIVCNPFVAIQFNGYSDNMKQFWNYDGCFKDRKLFGRN
jgi:hypothetical protein